MRTQITKAPWVSEDDPKALGDCAGGSRRTSLRAVERCEKVVVVGLIVLSMCLMLPAPMLRAPLVNNPQEVMSKVYDELVMGRSSLEVLGRLSSEQRRAAKESEIGWITSIPVRTSYGVLNPRYLPVDHVVVYGMPELAVGTKRWRGPWYCDAMGVRHALRETDTGQGKASGGAGKLKKLVLTTRFGTFDVLKGSVTDIAAIGDVDRFDRSLLDKYLILKKLMVGDAEYLRYAVECVDEVEDWFEWVNPLLQRSIVRPSPPAYYRRDADGCRRAWGQWLAVYGEDFEFTNEFLFEAASPVEDVRNGDGSSRYVVDSQSNGESPT